jgi:DNA helicase-2/ATP-dependent DNA helicase PcrA
MNFLTDLHIHSPYSRATSRHSNLPGLAAWAGVKGIHVIGTGDFTHPGWFKELSEQLIPAEQGLFKLADPAIPPVLPDVRPSPDIRFMLTAEISCIYKRQDQVRKVHNIIFCPDLEQAQQFNRRLATIGNIHSDGRPILGLDSRDLLEIVLEEIPAGFLVPAHIWTPWFSLFGSKSGFDSIDDCFGDLTEHIFALETGLSSDPAMNRLISALDRFTLMSNSDCHSPAKLGREATIFACDLSFHGIQAALKDPSKGLQGTIEFYPEEGKYHHDGHRKCGLCFDPQTTREHGGLCPVCSKPVTVGVANRIMELADRDTPLFPQDSPAFESLIPLQEILSELLGVGPNTKTVLKQYSRLIKKFGSEFSILRSQPLEDLQRDSPLLGEAINRVRQRQVVRLPGFDGQFGVIRAFQESELSQLAGQHPLFNNQGVKRKQKH